MSLDPNLVLCLLIILTCLVILFMFVWSLIRNKEFRKDFIANPAGASITVNKVGTVEGPANLVVLAIVSTLLGFAFFTIGNKVDRKEVGGSTVTLNGMEQTNEELREALGESREIIDSLRADESEERTTLLNRVVSLESENAVLARTLEQSVDSLQNVIQQRGEERSSLHEKNKRLLLENEALRKENISFRLAEFKISLRFHPEVSGSQESLVAALGAAGFEIEQRIDATVSANELVTYTEHEIYVIDTLSPILSEHLGSYDEPAPVDPFLDSQINIFLLKVRSLSPPINASN